MAIVTIQDYKVYSKYWYLVDFTKLTKVKLLPFYFLNPKSAKRALKANYPKKKRKFIEVMKGSKVKDFFLIYCMGNRLGKYTKYEYSPEKMTHQERKSHRTLMRRRLRRMGLLTLVNPKKSVRDKPDYIKPIINKQKVANSPKSIAKVIRIERKPSRYYYLIHNVKLAKKKKVLWEIEGLRYNATTGEIKKVKVKVYRTDLLIPYLLTDLEDIIYEKIKQEPTRAVYYAKWGFKAL